MVQVDHWAAYHEFGNPWVACCDFVVASAYPYVVPCFDDELAYDELVADLLVVLALEGRSYVAVVALAVEVLVGHEVVHHVEDHDRGRAQLMGRHY